MAPTFALTTVVVITARMGRSTTTCTGTIALAMMAPVAITLGAQRQARITSQTRHCATVAVAQLEYLAAMKLLVAQVPTQMASLLISPQPCQPYTPCLWHLGRDALSVTAAAVHR